MSQVAYVINTTPKYFYLLPLHLTLLRRYAPELGWKVYLATEDVEAADRIKCDFPELHIIPLDAANAGFFESRLAASKALSVAKYIFPIQEDFLLEARPLYSRIEEAIQLLESDNQLGSVRLMPCPGHNDPTGSYWAAEPEMPFSYQATIWRREIYETFLQSLIDWIDERYPGARQDRQKSIALAIKVNLAEIKIGQDLMRKICTRHLCARREHNSPNAVYLAPWPYRPTAVVKGVLQSWAVELAEREGCPFSQE